MSPGALASLPSGRGVDLLNDHSWAMTRLISRASATGNSRGILPVVATPEGREVGAHCSSLRSSARIGYLDVLR